MEEKESKNKEIVISKSTYFKDLNKTNQIEEDKVAPEGRSLSFKKEGSQNKIKEIPKETAIKKIDLSPESPTYQTQTFNSHTPLNSRLNFDSLSDKNGLKEPPMSREKKIYLYLTNNNTGNNSDPSSILETPKTIFRKPDENIEKLSLEESNKEEIIDNFKKANIINNISNNNVNNIFVNFISSNIQTNLSRNVINEQYNNSFNGKMLNNNILEDGINKGSIQKIEPKDSNTIFIRDRQTEPKIMINNTINKDDRTKYDKLDYYDKIMNSANSYTYDKLNNPLDDLKEEKIGQKKRIIFNKTINNEEKLTEIESNRFLKNYIKNKSNNLKNNKIIYNIKRHNNSFSQAKARDFRNTIFNNNNNPIFINIISKNPFQEEIEEENEFDMTFSSKKSKKIEKKIKNSSTTKFLNSKYNNLKSPFIYSNRNKPNNLYQNYNISKNNLTNNLKKINSFYKNKKFNSINNYSSININDNISYKSINNCKKKFIGKNNSKIISDSIIKSKENNNNKLYSSAFNTINTDNKTNSQSIAKNNNIINIDINKKNKNINANKNSISIDDNDKNKNEITKIVKAKNYNIIKNIDINKNKNIQNFINNDNIKKKSNNKKKKKKCSEIINNINELNNSINNINNKNKALYNNTNLIFIKSNKKNKKSSQNNKDKNINSKLFNENYNKNTNNIVYISNRNNYKSFSTDKRNIINNNLNSNFDRSNQNSNFKDNNTERKSIRNNNPINPKINIQNKNSVVKNINNEIDKKIINNINKNNNSSNNNNIVIKNLSNLSNSVIDNLQSKENNKTIYKKLNIEKNSNTNNNNINDINNKTIKNNSKNYLSSIIKKDSFNNINNNNKNNKTSNNLNSTLTKKSENIKMITIINKINTLTKKDINIKSNLNNNTKMNTNGKIKNMSNSEINKIAIIDINLRNEDDDDLINSKNISTKNVIINNYNPSNNTVSFIDGNSEKKNNNSIKKNNEFLQIYTNNNKNINFIKAKNILPTILTDNDTVNKIKNSNKIDNKDNKDKKDNKDNKDNKENKKKDLKNKNKIKKINKNTFTNTTGEINSFIKKEEKKEVLKNKNNSIVQINYSNGVPKKIFEQKNNITNNSNKEKKLIEEINILKNFNNNSSIVVSPTKGIIATNTLVYNEENEEKGIFIHRLRGKSSLVDVPKKKCEICNNMIETHLFKIHLNSHPTEIFNWMYLGTYQNACDINELRRLGINCILNCASECLNNNLPEDIKELHLHIRDEEDFDLIPYFEEANVFINKARLLGQNILIHCKFGISRSVSFIMAYLIKYFRFNVQGALNYVRRRRKQINPNQGFFDQLIEYEKYIKEIKK